MLTTLDCSTIDRIAHCVELVRSCDIVRTGALRISTPFSYPNGDNIDIFLYSKSSSLLNEYRVSDGCQTYLYLKSAQVELFGTSRKREIIGDITSQLNVKLNEGELFVSVAGEELDSFSDAIFRIAQACMRISDFATHQRLRSSNPFRDDVEDFFDAKGLGYLRDVKILNQYGSPVRMDFEVSAPDVKSYVNVLAALNKTAAHSMATEIFTKLYDLNQVNKNGHQLVTIYNSASNAIRETDIRRLSEFSNVVSYPEQPDLLESILSGKAA